MSEFLAPRPAPAVETSAPVAAPRRSREIAAPRVVLQPKLSVGAVDDPLEAEADRVADHITAILRRSVALPDGRQGHADPDDPSERRQATPRIRRSTRPGTRVDTIARVYTPSVTKIAAAHRCGPMCGHTLRVRRHAGHDHGHDHPEVGAAGGEISDDLSSKIRSAGRGSRIDERVRGPLESAFGSSFAHVGVHTDSKIARKIGAEAFTVGSDIHFAPGRYRPNDQAGQWLLSHELTHVVQQSGGAPDAGISRWTGSCIHRHASKEHYMLGSMTPDQIRSIAEAKEKIESLDTGITYFTSIFTGPKLPPKEELDEAITSVSEQLSALENWRQVTGPMQPDPASVEKGKTEYDHHWGGQLVTVQCLDGEVACTVGELNALPDFFGSFDDLKKVSRSVVFKTFQVIRRETYIYLKSLQAQLTGKKYSYDKEKEGFTGLKDNGISVSNAALPKVGNDVADLLQTGTMLAGDTSKGETGLDVSIGAEATLGRNACHFPPESWLRWREHHTQARDLIAGAATLDELGVKANEAIGRNAFGEHYLQDSFAGGHLINKGFVMAVAMEHASAATKKFRGMTDERIRELQHATAHAEAYDLPEAAKQKLDDRQLGFDNPNAMDDPTITARDPQSALENAKAAGGTKDDGKKNEMLFSGIDPESMSFEQYRTWLNDFWLQKITNTLHDKYCINGLEVASPDNPSIFKIYGDNNMMRSSEGAEYTAETSLMSRNAINALVDNRRAQLAAQQPNANPAPPPKPVASIEAIVARFPNTVKDDDGTVMSLKEWATGEPMRKKIANMVSIMSKDSWTDGKLTAVVRLASSVKSVAAGLDSSHGPF